jgi:hypothetical protein
MTYKVANELTVGFACSRDDLSASSMWHTISDVLCDGAGEEYGLLTNESNLSPQLLRVQLRDVSAVYSDGAGCWHVEAQEQASDGGLSSSTGRNNSNIGPLLDLEVQILEDRDRWPRWVAEGDVLELNRAARRLYWLALCRRYGWFAILEFEKSTGSSDALHHLAIESRQTHHA